MEQEKDAVKPAWWKRAGRRFVRELPWLLLAVAAYWVATSRQTPEVEIGSVPQPFQAQVIGGGVIDTVELRGKPLLLVFWAPWCKVCATEMPLINDLQASFGKDANVLGVGLSGPRADMEEFVRNHEPGFPNVYGDQDIAARFGIRAFPTMVLLDGDGAVRERLVGITTPWRIRWEVSRLTGNEAE